MKKNKEYKEAREFQNYLRLKEKFEGKSFNQNRGKKHHNLKRKVEIILRHTEFEGGRSIFIFDFPV